MLDRHFSFQEESETTYRRRYRDPDALAAVAACERRFARAPEAAKAFRADGEQRKAYLRERGRLSAAWDRPIRLPSHHGYEQLAIIREKQGDYAATKARRQNKPLPETFGGEIAKILEDGKCRSGPAGVAGYGRKWLP